MCCKYYSCHKQNRRRLKSVECHQEQPQHIVDVEAEFPVTVSPHETEPQHFDYKIHYSTINLFSVISISKSLLSLTLPYSLVDISARVLNNMPVCPSHCTSD